MTPLDEYYAAVLQELIDVNVRWQRRVIADIDGDWDEAYAVTIPPLAGQEPAAPAGANEGESS